MSVASATVALKFLAGLSYRGKRWVDQADHLFPHFWPGSHFETDSHRERASATGLYCASGHSPLRAAIPMRLAKMHSFAVTVSCRCG